MSAEEKWIGHRALALLRPGAFRRYIIGSAISDTGTWMQVMAQGWVMSTLTNKAILLGMANFAAGLPTLALTMVGGSAADRFDKRKILIATQIAQIAFAIALGWLVLINRIQIWHIIFFAALLGISIAFAMPAISSLVPGHADTLRAQCAGTRAQHNRLAHGNIRHRIIVRLARCAQHRPRPAAEIHERQCACGRGRGFSHVAFARLCADCLFDGMSRHRALHELWSGKYDCSGTRAPSPARPCLSCFRPEFFWFNADRWSHRHRIFRFGRHADRPRRLVGDLWNSRLCSSEHGRTSRM